MSARGWGSLQDGVGTSKVAKISKLLSTQIHDRRQRGIADSATVAHRMDLGEGLHAAESASSAAGRMVVNMLGVVGQWEVVRLLRPRRAAQPHRGRTRRVA